MTALILALVLGGISLQFIAAVLALIDYFSKV